MKTKMTKGAKALDFNIKQVGKRNIALSDSGRGWLDLTVRIDGSIFRHEKFDLADKTRAKEAFEQEVYLAIRADRLLREAAERAAAPDLLAALTKAVELIPTSVDGDSDDCACLECRKNRRLIRVALAAIAKAQGR
jgi:hypothetical protein